MIFRVLFFIVVLLPVMVVIIPLQALINALKLPSWGVLPRFFHRMGRIFLGMRVTVIGQPATGRPTLLVSNHISWTDIVAVGSVAEVTFVAKREVGEWFFVGMMARLQKTIFVDRTRRSDAGRTAQLGLHHCPLRQLAVDNPAVACGVHRGDRILRPSRGAYLLGEDYVEVGV